MLTRKLALALTIAIALGGVVSEANAKQIGVTYDLAGVPSVLNGILQLSPGVFGKMKVRYSCTGSSPGTVVSGPAGVTSFSINGPSDLNLWTVAPLVRARLTGPLLLEWNATVNSPIAATLAAGTLQVGPATGMLSGIVHCNGIPGTLNGDPVSGCAGGGAALTLATFPNTVPITITATVNATLPGTLKAVSVNPATVNTVTFTSRNLAAILDVPITFQNSKGGLVATEVARTECVPEPTSMALKLAALLAVAWRARRARR